MTRNSPHKASASLRVSRMVLLFLTFEDTFALGIVDEFTQTIVDCTPWRA